MPMESQAERRFLWATKPDVAKKMEKDTPKGEKLPEHVKPATSKKGAKGRGQK